MEINQTDILIKYMDIIQNTHPFFMILSYLDYFPIPHSFSPFIFNPLTCAVCPKILDNEENRYKQEDNVIYCSYECLCTRQNKSFPIIYNLLGKKTYISKNQQYTSNSYKKLIEENTFNDYCSYNQKNNIKNNINNL